MPQFLLAPLLLAIGLLITSISIRGQSRGPGSKKGKASSTEASPSSAPSVSNASAPDAAVDATLEPVETEPLPVVEPVDEEATAAAPTASPARHKVRRVVAPSRLRPHVFETPEAGPDQPEASEVEALEVAPVEAPGLETPVPGPAASPTVSTASTGRIVLQAAFATMFVGALVGGVLLGASILEQRTPAPPAQANVPEPGTAILLPAVASAPVVAPTLPAPSPTAVHASAPAPVARVAAAGDRQDCAAIAGTSYRSPTERTWFLANCSDTAVSADASPITLRAIPATVCPTGLAFVVNPLPNVSPLVADRAFCLEESHPFGDAGFRVSVPFSCPAGTQLATHRDELVIADEAVVLDEVTCRS